MMDDRMSDQLVNSAAEGGYINDGSTNGLHEIAK